MPLMCLKQELKLLVLVLLICMPSSSSEISDKQYASMPNLFVYDNYDNCLLYDEEALYCTFTFQLFPKNPESPSKIWRIIEEVSSKSNNYRHDLLRHGICIPETCPNITISTFLENHQKFIQEVEACYNQKYKSGIFGKIQKIRCETKDSSHPINAFDIIFGLFIVLFVALILCSWCYDMLSNFKDKSEEEIFLKTFHGKLVASLSLSQNWKRLTTINLNHPDLKKMSCLQGMRVFAMVIIIFGHTVLVNLSLPVTNPKYVEGISQSFSTRWIGNGSRYTIIQTFFMISAWLLTYQFFTDMEGKKKVSFSYLLRSVINRYIRLTPTLAIMVGFYASWMVHLYRGPFWEQMVEVEYRQCRTNWWSNLLYLNNYIHGEEMCSLHHWSMAIDTQHYITSLFLLTFIWYNQDKIAAILGSLWMLHLSAVFYIIYKNDWEPVVPLYPENLYDLNVARLDETHAIFKSSISNFGGFIGGIAYGYIFYKYKNQEIYTKRIYVTLWWILSFGAIFGTFIFSELMTYLPGYEENRFLYNAIYGSLNRSFYIFGTGLWILGMTQGQGYLTRFVCEWPPLYILGRLTYSASLVHCFLQRFKAGMYRSPLHVSDYRLFFETVGDVAIAYVGAAFLTLVFEMPIAQLHKRFSVSKLQKNGLKVK